MFSIILGDYPSRIIINTFHMTERAGQPQIKQIDCHRDNNNRLTPVGWDHEEIHRDFDRIYQNDYNDIKRKIGDWGQDRVQRGSECVKDEQCGDGHGDALELGGEGVGFYLVVLHLDYWDLLRGLGFWGHPVGGLLFGGFLGVGSLGMVFLIPLGGIAGGVFLALLLLLIVGRQEQDCALAEEEKVWVAWFVVM